MFREGKPGTTAPSQRSAPSIAHTVQAFRAIRGRESRAQPRRRIIAIRSGRQLA